MAWDTSLFYLINHGMAQPWLDSLMWWLSLLGWGPGIWGIGGLLLLIWPGMPRRIRAIGAALFFVTFIGLLTEYGIKPLVGRLRPSAVLADARVLFESGNYSFPSGHATVAFAAAAVIWRMVRPAGPPALLLAALVALSRIYLGNHWPSDVLAGAAVGFAFGWWFAGFISRSFAPSHTEKVLGHAVQDRRR